MLYFLYDLMRKILLILLIIFQILDLDFAYAQSSEVLEVPISAVVIANINLSDAQIVSKDSEALKLVFTLTNLGDIPQADIRYGVEFIKTVESGEKIIVDSFVSQITQTVPAGDNISITTDVPILGLPAGTYDVWIKARNTGGITLGTGNAGSITVSESNAVEIKPETCSSNVPGNDNLFNLNQSPSIALGEELAVSCVVTNHSLVERKVTPQFTTHKRTLFSEPVSLKKINTEILTLAPGESRLFDVILPKVQEPQVYYTTVYFTDSQSEELASNHFVVNYVLKGTRATILNINFSKSNYMVGENIDINFFWTMINDTVSDSIEDVADRDLVAEIRLTDQYGNMCAPLLSQILTKSPVTLSIDAADDCLELKATLSLKSVDDVVLDSRTLTASREVTTEEETNGTEVSTFSKLLLIIIATSIALVVVFLLLVVRLMTNTGSATKLLLLISVISFGFFLGGAEKVEAVTLIFNDPYGSAGVIAEFNVNTNKNNYTTGETISVSGNISLVPCCNGTNSYVTSFYLALASDGEALPWVTETGNFVTSFSNPANSGNNEVDVRARVTFWPNGVGFQNEIIPISVNDPLITASIDSPNCVIAVGQNRCDSNVLWDTSGIAAPSIRQNGGEFADNPSGNMTRSLYHGGYQFTVVDGSTVRAIDYAQASCPMNAPWNSSTNRCEVTTGPYATINAPDCDINLNQSTCISQSVSWNSGNFTGLTNITHNGAPISSASQSSTNVPLSRGLHTFAVMDAAVQRAVDTANAECADGLYWNNGRCETAIGPVGNISASPSPCLIAAGGSQCYTLLTWSSQLADYPQLRIAGGGILANLANGTNYMSPWIAHGATVVYELLERFPDTILDTVAVTAVCEPGSTWNGTTCEADAPPLTTNLTSDMQPVVNFGALTQGQNVTFRGTLRNSGITNVTTAFSDSFTYCWGSGSCSPTTPLSSLSQSPINAGVSRNDVSTALNLNQNGTLRVRHCVDSTFSITESDENDNCQTATFNVSPAASSPALIICPDDPVTVAEGQNVNLQAWYWGSYLGSPDCGIGGSSNVTNSASWSSEDEAIATVTNDKDTTRGVVTGVSEDTVEITAMYSSLSAERDVTVTAGAGGGGCSTSPCPPPDIEIVSNPGIVRSGETAGVEITITADYLLQCELAGAATEIFTHAGDINPTDHGPYDSTPLTAATVAEVTCTDPYDVDYQASTTISVIPTFQEI